LEIDEQIRGAKKRSVSKVPKRQLGENRRKNGTTYERAVARTSSMANCQVSFFLERVKWEKGGNKRSRE